MAGLELDSTSCLGCFLSVAGASHRMEASEGKLNVMDGEEKG